MRKILYDITIDCVWLKLSCDIYRKTAVIAAHSISGPWYHKPGPCLVRSTLICWRHRIVHWRRFEDWTLSSEASCIQCTQYYSVLYMPLIANFTAWIQVDGETLPEYGMKYSEDGKQASCWIPSEVPKVSVHNRIKRIVDLGRSAAICDLCQRLWEEFYFCNNCVCGWYTLLWKNNPRKVYPSTPSSDFDTIWC